MQLHRLGLEQYRNFPSNRFDFKERTAVIGLNGAGKSNLIEALRLLSVGKSFKTSRLDEAVRFGEQYFRLKAEVKQAEYELIEFFYGLPFPSSPIKERQLILDKKAINWTDFWGRFPSVLFIPNDIEIVIGAPQLRRRYLDSILWQVDAEFRHDHLELSRVLKERSSLLFLIKVNRSAPDELSPWNELLTNLSERIRHKRQGLVEFFQEKMRLDMPKFTDRWQSNIDYKINPVKPDEVYKEEVRLAQNLVGPQRDELEIFFNDASARKFASRGQARAIVVLLKAAEAAFLKERSRTSPLVLLDDMFSELDQPTAETLFLLFGNDYQVVASSIEPSPLISDWHQIRL